MRIRRLPPPPGGHPLIGRQRHLLVGLRAGVVLVAALSASALVLPDPAATWAATGVVAALVAIPAVRVAWLAVRWVRRGDLRYAAVAGAVLAILGVAATIALLG